MGLLDQILGGGGGLGRGPAVQRSGLGGVLMSLLPVVLGMLANRQRGGGLGGAAGPGGMFGGGAAQAPGGFGGLGGLLEQFRQRGLASQADSWVSTGPNQPLAPEQVDGVFGQQEISRIAEQAGLNDIETREGLAQLIPDVVDRLTPDGQIPPDDRIDSGIDELMRQLRA